LAQIPHFMARNPWFSYHTLLREPLAMLTGGLPSEVVCMNTLTVNLHLMMVSFYRPTRFKIIIEAGAFPSDYYTVETQIAFHGYNPETALIENPAKVKQPSAQKTLFALSKNMAHRWLWCFSVACSIRRGNVLT